MRALPLALGIAGTWTALAVSGTLEPLERLTVQARYMLRPTPGHHAPVAIVAIDERSLQRYGQMPWDRRLFARLLDRLQAEHAAVVGIDVAFNEPARDPSEDRALATALGHVPTVLPTFLAYTDAGRQTLRSIEPLPAFATAAVALGSIQLSSRQQAQVWEVEPYQDALGRWVPAFPVAVAGAYKGAAWSPAKRGFPWRDAPALIDFRGPANSAFHVSAVDVLEGKAPPEAFKGRMVLVGAVAAGLPDTNFAVPDFRGGPMSGVELSANVLENLLGDGFLRRFNGPAIALLLLALACGPGRRLTVGLTGSLPRTAWLAGAALAWSALAVWLFQVGVWLELVPVLGFLASCYLAGGFAERTALLESRNQLLGRYASDLASEAQRQRSRIEGELHDGIQQLLVVISRELRQIQRQPLAEPMAARLAGLGQLTEQAHQEIKRLRGDLLPPALRYGGLLEALPSLASETSARSGLDVRLEVASWAPLPREREVELYWLIKEALNNVEKHAGARQVRIRLERALEAASIEVDDDGAGFTPPDLSRAPDGVDHSGLHRMWLRMRGNQGDLRIVSRPGQGTSVRFSLSLIAGRSA